MIDGEPPYDLTELDQGRYGNWTSKEYVMAKTRESYGLNNQIGHPKLERPAGRPVRKNGIFEVRSVFRSKKLTRLEANQSKRSHHEEHRLKQENCLKHGKCSCLSILDVLGY